MKQRVSEAEAMEALGAAFADACGDTGCRIYLQGELGTGKTTWVRGFLRGFGYTDAVKSPSFALMEQYDLRDHVIVHLDLYRIADPEELESIGMRDWFDRDTICLVEWPERGARMLPAPDLHIQLDYDLPGRHISAVGHTRRGQALLARLDLPTD